MRRIKRIKNLAAYILAVSMAIVSTFPVQAAEIEDTGTSIPVFADELARADEGGIACRQATPSEIVLNETGTMAQAKEETKAGTADVLSVMAEGETDGLANIAEIDCGEIWVQGFHAIWTKNNSNVTVNEGAATAYVEFYNGKEDEVAFGARDQDTGITTKDLYIRNNGTVTVSGADNGNHMLSLEGYDGHGETFYVHSNMLSVTDEVLQRIGGSEYGDYQDKEDGGYHYVEPVPGFAVLSTGIAYAHFFFSHYKWRRLAQNNIYLQNHRQRKSRTRPIRGLQRDLP